MAILSVVTEAILPLVLVVSTGVLLNRYGDVKSEGLNSVAINVLLPALVFHSLATTDLPMSTLANVGIAVVSFLLLMTLISEVVGRGLGETEPFLGTFVLVTVFPNAGNYGLPVAEFIFGETGRASAVIYIVAVMVIMNTLGVYVAGRSGAGDWREGVKAIFSIPLIYAVVFAGISRGIGILPPADAAVMQTLKLVGDSVIPVVLIVLGIELADARYGKSLARITPAVGLKMLIGPLVALAIAVAIGFQNQDVAHSFVLLSATPTAVTPLIIVNEFAAQSTEDLTVSEYASSTILLTTIVSIPVVTVLAALLKADVLV